MLLSEMKHACCLSLNYAPLKFMNLQMRQVLYFKKGHADATKTHQHVPFNTGLVYFEVPHIFPFSFTW